MPPDADPVRAASTLVATASDTNGPPPTDSTQSLTRAKPGNAATTAPNPTRLATLTAGKTEALAPASMLSRNAERRERLTAITVPTATASATTTDHTPLTADRDVAPHRSSARKDKSSRGNTTSDITRLTTTTTTSGNTADTMGGY